MTFKEFVEKAKEIKPEEVLFVSVDYERHLHRYPIPNHVETMVFSIWDGTDHYKGKTPEEALMVFAQEQATLESVGEIA